MNQQHMQPNLAAGFRNNTPANQPQPLPRGPPPMQGGQPMRPQHVNLQTVPPEVLQSIRTQLLEEMNGGGPQGPNPNPIPGDINVGDDSYSILGFSLQRKYVYIIACILLLIVGYYLWKWYTSKPAPVVADDDESEDEEQDFEFDGMLGYPDQAQQNRLMQQQLMQQQLMQQQMMQRKLAEQQKGKGKEEDEPDE